MHAKPRTQGSGELAGAESRVFWIALQSRGSRQRCSWLPGTMQNRFENSVSSSEKSRRLTMPKFTTPKRCLLENWKDACLLADSMKTLRVKYAEIIEEVQDKVQQEHRDLDCTKIYVRRNGT